jgi:CheY-like chemotaxis protein
VWTILLTTSAEEEGGVGMMQGARILLVEDDEVLRDLLRRNLEARGHDVSMAADAQTALAHLRAAPFDLVILDINLPDQTGWEILRTAQREGVINQAPTQEAQREGVMNQAPTQEIDGGEYKLPVVVLSAVRVSPRRLAEFRPLAYLPKPFPMEAVLRLATEAAQRRNGDVVTEEEETESSLPTEAPIRPANDATASSL